MSIRPASYSLRAYVNAFSVKRLLLSPLPFHSYLFTFFSSSLELCVFTTHTRVVLPLHNLLTTFSLPTPSLPCSRPVYEYPLNNQWIMMDIDDGYILWTGIWKALGNSKADIVKMVDSQPDLAPVIRRVRGGYLKIQGTWMPYEVALKLARR